jgi:hypothetical protein
VPLPLLRAMSLLAHPVAPVFARQARAAVVMNTTDMTTDGAALRDRFPTVSSTTLDELLVPITSGLGAHDRELAGACPAVEGGVSWAGQGCAAGGCTP